MKALVLVAVLFAQDYPTPPVVQCIGCGDDFKKEGERFTPLPYCTGSYCK